jgi:16S rRNA (guanine527-N7)-methyltransferase
VFAELLRARLGSVVDLSPAQIGLLETHFELLERWSKVLNLTSIHKTEEIVERHYCESLFLAEHLPNNISCIADLGSGAGFPGIPVAVLRPNSSVTLIESNLRKSVFLREATRALPNTLVVAERADAVTRSFDWLVSRAVKYCDISLIATKLSAHIALLAGENVSGDSCFTWNARIRVPWGNRRYLYLGTRVPRGTS